LKKHFLIIPDNCPELSKNVSSILMIDVRRIGMIIKFIEI